MRESGLALVSHIGFADPAIVEIIALAGFDGVFIDMEHTGFDLQLSTTTKVMQHVTQ